MRPLSTAASCRLLFAPGFLFLIVTSSSAQDLAMPTENTGASMLLAYARPAAKATDEFVSFTRIEKEAPKVTPSPPAEPRRQTRSLLDLGSGSNDEVSAAEDLLRASAAASRMRSDQSVSLLRTRVSTHYSYETWADVHTGYGQYFDNDTFARALSSGAGVQDRDWFYVKMTLSF